MTDLVESEFSDLAEPELHTVSEQFAAISNALPMAAMGPRIDYNNSRIKSDGDA